MRQVFLIGGGRDDDAAVRAAHAPFLAACAPEGPIVALILEEDGVDVQRWVGNLAPREVRPVLVPREPVSLDGAAGVYVAGGLTPAYLDALADLGIPEDLPYAGFSAGAAIAARSALTGGWRIGDRQVCDEDFSEDVEQVEPRPGLGLVGFAVDVHATQWGTVSRALHAVERGCFEEVVAIDEHCCVEVRGEEIAGVHGRGVAYRIRPGLRVDVLAA